MAMLIIFHEVEDGARWAKAWQKGVGSRHEMFERIGVTCRTFRDPQNPNSTGLVVAVPDMEKFQSFMASEEAARAMKEDGLKPETMRVLGEFTP
ncbi:MAG: hypothetical protein WBQ57_00715 [Rhodanobacteraceae bacterium]